jgi:predicted  nucleic acid-binding Zn-ribbon protein
MLTNEDVKKLIEVLATKEDIKDLKQDVDGLREIVQALVVSIDKLVKAVSDLKTEYVAITNQVSRHEKWFQQIAEKLGMKLEH